VTSDAPRMYHELADWFHLLTAPEDYEEEATFYFAEVVRALGRKPHSWLELGSGGGNNASHYAPWVDGEVVLSDRSGDMLALSRKLNPDIEHVRGDMLTVRLGRTFDVVFVHDAASYLTTEDQARQLAETAFAHSTPGGVTIICPNHTAENVAFETDHGGHDGDGRALRYLEWTTRGDPGTNEYIVDYAFILHEDGKPARVELDRHINGALPRQLWLDALTAAGFAEARGTPLVHSEVPEGSSEFFVAKHPP
jgi:SAM-dependent methyltransferase